MEKIEAGNGSKLKVPLNVSLYWILSPDLRTFKTFLDHNAPEMGSILSSLSFGKQNTIAGVTILHANSLPKSDMFEMFEETPGKPSSRCMKPH